ncbi:hypothetical protein OQA88_3807 [Cercophora sp. LCS_1]
MDYHDEFHPRCDTPHSRYTPLYERRSQSSSTRQRPSYGQGAAFELTLSPYAALPSGSHHVRAPARLPPLGIIQDDQPSPPFFKHIDWHGTKSHRLPSFPPGSYSPHPTSQANESASGPELDHERRRVYSLVYSSASSGSSESSTTSPPVNPSPSHLRSGRTPPPLPPVSALAFFENELTSSQAPIPICHHHRHSQIYAICLAATKRYILTHRENYHAREAPGPLRTANHNERYAPYRRHQPRSNSSTNNNPISALLNRFLPPGTPIPPSTSQISTPNYPFSEATESLLQNITTICSVLWHRAQRTRLDEIGVERRTVSEMGDLLSWAETIEFAGRGEIGRACVGRTNDINLEEVIRCGRMLCGVLQDWEGEGRIGQLL